MVLWCEICGKSYNCYPCYRVHKFNSSALSIDDVNIRKICEIELAKDGDEMMEYGIYKSISIIDVARMKGGLEYLKSTYRYARDFNSHSVYGVASKKWNYKSIWS